MKEIIGVQQDDQPVEDLPADMEARIDSAVGDLTKYITKNMITPLDAFLVNGRDRPKAFITLYKMMKLNKPITEIVASEMLAQELGIPSRSTYKIMGSFSGFGVISLKKIPGMERSKYLEFDPKYFTAKRMQLVFDIMDGKISTLKSTVTIPSSMPTRGRGRPKWSKGKEDANADVPEMRKANSTMQDE